MYDRCDRGGVLDGGLRIRHAHLDGPEARVRAELPPPDARLGDPAGARAPRECVRVLLPAVQWRRHPLARQELAQLGADGCEAGVRAAVEGRVSGESEQLGEVVAEAVVDGERFFRRADRDVHLQAEHELAPGEAAVLPARALVPFALVELALLVSERMDAGA